MDANEGESAVEAAAEVAPKVLWYCIAGNCVGWR